VFLWVWVSTQATREPKLFWQINCDYTNLKYTKLYHHNLGHFHWPLRLDAEGAQKSVSFFKFFPLCFCWFVSWHLTISGSDQCRGAPMESKLRAAAMTGLSRFGTRNLEIASRRWEGTRTGKFFFWFFFNFFWHCESTVTGHSNG